MLFADWRVKARGYWGGMLYPLLNMSAAGAVLYEGQLDVERKTNMTQYQCLLNQTVNMWRGLQKLDKERDPSDNYMSGDGSLRSDKF